MLLLLPWLSMKCGMIEDIHVLEEPGLARDIGYGPGMPLLGPDDFMDVPDLWSSVAAGQMGTSPVLEDTSASLVSVGVVIFGPDPPNPEFRVMSRQQIVLSKTVAGPVDFFPESGRFSTRLTFVGALLPGHGGPSPESGGAE